MAGCVIWEWEIWSLRADCYGLMKCGPELWFILYSRMFISINYFNIHNICVFALYLKREHPLPKHSRHGNLVSYWIKMKCIHALTLSGKQFISPQCPPQPSCFIWIGCSWKRLTHWPLLSCFSLKVGQIGKTSSLDVIEATNSMRNIAESNISANENNTIFICTFDYPWLHEVACLFLMVLRHSAPPSFLPQFSVRNAVEERWVRNGKEQKWKAFVYSVCTVYGCKYALII